MIDGLRRLAQLVSFPPIEEQVLLTDQELEDLGIIVDRTPNVNLTPEVSLMVLANPNGPEHVLPEEHSTPDSTARIEIDSRSIPSPAEAGEDNHLIHSHDHEGDALPVGDGDTLLNRFGEDVGQNRAAPLAIAPSAHTNTTSGYIPGIEDAPPRSPELKQAEEGAFSVKQAEFDGEGESTGTTTTVQTSGHGRLEDSSAIAPVESRSK